MRKFKFMLPAFAILLAAVVLTGELGASLGAQSPRTTPAVADEGTYTSEDSDISATSWVETGAKTPDTRKPRLPVKGQAAKKK